MKKTVVSIGEILWDVFPQGKRLGGAPANFAWNMAQLGYRARLLTAVGRDELGREILQRLAPSGLDADVQQTDYPTGSVQVETDAAGVPTYRFRADVAWDHLRFTEAEAAMAASADCVCYGTLASRSTETARSLEAFLQVVARRKTACRVFDVNLRQDFYSRELIERLLGLSDVVKVNEEELEVLAGMWLPGAGDREEKCRELLARFGLRLVVLTCGGQGSLVVCSDGEISRKSSPAIEIADTVGAGDAFTAGFCAGLLGRKRLERCHELGVELASFVCTRPGAMQQIPQALREKFF